MVAGFAFDFVALYLLVLGVFMLIVYGLVG